VNADAPQRVPVFVVLPPRTLLLDVAGPVEVLRVANLAQSRVRFDVRHVSPSPRVTSSIGLVIADLAALPASLPDDAVVIVAGSVTELAFVDGAQGGQRASEDEQTIVDWLRARVRECHSLICICSGALLAARAGWLDERTCTTHFACCGDLARLAPRARVVENRLFVQDGNIRTSAGVSAGIDLMLHEVAQRVDTACALAVARHLVVYLRRGGADPQLSPWLAGRNHIHPAVHRVQDAIGSDPAHEWTLAGLAQAASTSARHLSRLFNEHAGMGIRDFINRMRVALARELIANTRLDMEHVAERCGFASARQLRRAWRRMHATSPQAARALLERSAAG